MHNFDPRRLSEALESIPATAWSLPSTFTATGVHHGYRRAVLVDAGRLLPEAEPFRFMLDAFEPVYEAWVSLIEPGGFIIPHCDRGPFRERWQVPVVTAGNGLSGDAGVPFRVAHWKPHAVWNTSDRARVHVVIDRAVWMNPKEPYAASFETFDVPEEFRDLVARAGG